MSTFEHIYHIVTCLILQGSLLMWADFWFVLISSTTTHRMSKSVAHATVANRSSVEDSEGSPQSEGSDANSETTRFDDFGEGEQSATKTPTF